MDARLQQAVDGDQQAFGELLFMHHSRLSRFIAGKLPDDLRSRIEVDDVLQQTYVDAYRGIVHFEPKSDRGFYRWLESIAEHRLLDMLRAARRKKRGGGRRQVQNLAASSDESYAGLFDVIAGDLTSPSSRAARREGTQALLVQLAALPSDYQAVIRLRYVEGMSHEEIAAATGHTPDAVRGLLYRGRKKLRDAMGQSSLWLSKK